MAREWRRRDLVHKSASHPHGRRDLVLRGKDSRRRDEDNEGEVCALVFWEVVGFFLEMGSHSFFYPSWSGNSSQGSKADVLFTC